MVVHYLLFCSIKDNNQDIIAALKKTAFVVGTALICFAAAGNTITWIGLFYVYISHLVFSVDFTEKILMLRGGVRGDMATRLFRFSLSASF